MTQTAIEAAESKETKPPRTPANMASLVLGGGLVLLFALWLVLQAVNRPVQFTSAVVVGVNNGALYALIALGYTLVYGIIELINFAHGDLFMLSTVLAAAVIVTVFGATSANFGAIGVVLIALVVVMTFGAGLNMGAERLAYRRLRRAPKLAPLITAVGLSFAYQFFGVFFNGSAQKQWPQILGDEGFKVGSVSVSWSTIVVILVTVPLLLVMTWFVTSTRQGKAMRATAQDQDAARLMGIDVDRTIAITFALGGALAGAAGVLYMEANGITRWDAGFRLGLIAFTAAVLGGIGNLTGAVLGGFLIGVIENINNSLGFGQQWGQTVIFGILIVLMVFKPEGILGKPTTEKV
ncbi:MAG TPA: branched-chain amino acid ABC transporter permease [Kineosporiaceae bacterium]|nr:branched-chain amino acid ABC transporter permease [Kineosporiaceae bacterium]